MIGALGLSAAESDAESVPVNRKIFRGLVDRILRSELLSSRFRFHSAMIRSVLVPHIKQSVLIVDVLILRIHEKAKIKLAQDRKSATLRVIDVVAVHTQNISVLCAFGFFNSVDLVDIAAL